MIKEKNATIKSVSLGIEDHGLLTAYLHLDYGGTSQGFGGYCLDAKGANYCAIFIRGCLDTTRKREWKDLPGTVIRVRHGEAHLIEAIGHAIEDSWFYPKQAMELVG